MPLEKKKQEYKKCSHGHQNSANAKACWVCGESLEAPAKPQFTQVTNTTVTNIPSNFVDVNIADQECERYVPGRLRCDEKDPLGHPCTFFASCALRLKRFNKKTA